MTDIPALVILIFRFGLAAILYIFLGVGFYLIWKDLNLGANRQTQSGTPAIILNIQKNGKELRFTMPVVRIGRDPLSDCVLDHSTVSGKHAQLVFRQNQWWLYDLGSSNGTAINQLPVDIPTVLTSGDEIRCGKICIQIKIER